MSPRRSPGDGTLFKRGTDGLWVAGFTVDSQRYRVTAKNRGDAIRKRQELRTQVEAGVRVKGGKAKLSSWLDSWLEIHKPKVDPETWRSYETSVRLHIKPAIGNKQLEKLTPDDIRDMLAAIQKSSPRAAQKAYTTLRLALRVAMAERKISWNPAAVVDKPKHTVKRDPPFTVQESLHIMAVAEIVCDAVWAARWKAGFMTGKREGEVLGLTWDRVDLDNDVLDVSWQLQELKKVHGCGDPDGKQYPCGKTRVSFCPSAHWDFPNGFEHLPCERSLVWTRPKTKATQEQPIPIIAPLHDVLVELKERGGLNPHNLVFHYIDGSAISQSQDQKAWRRLLQAAEVPHRAQHTLRRTTATLLRTAQVDEQTRMTLFGHSGAETQRLYSEAGWDHYKVAMANLADVLAPKDLDEP
ncbi:tyrosine-type recombinase/integrase [Mycobacterium adipatum]|uniref:tyrosine-type recombinase/integrase n=1 Tax=Mycobacterium adipatum TaxID=1682113 RepID=UPI0034E06ED1